jgi:uncharacterized protein (TIGR00299 family) protein
MKLLYFDCPMGISGDMFLGALIDMGVDLGVILAEIKKLRIGEKYVVSTTREERHSISGTAFRVRAGDSHRHRTFNDIKRLIEGSEIAPEVKRLSVSIFRTIAEAEGRVHGISPGRVHFHEVGALDSIIDIVGAATAVLSLKIDRFVSGPIALGSGWTKTMHGTLPIPAPATLEILKGAPIAPSDVPFELTTPTGAAIVKTLADGFVSGMPAMVIEAVGYGAGKKDFRDAANVLRLVVGRAEGAAGAGGAEFVLETNIDDMSPQLAGFLMERLLDAGALDAYFTPVQMKKSRPGVLLTVIAREDTRQALLDIIFSESTTIGVRSYPVERHCLERKSVKAKTRWGMVRVKVSMRDGRVVNAQPEYEDCRAIAARKAVPLKDVIDAAKAAFRGEDGALRRRPGGT